MLPRGKSFISCCRCSPSSFSWSICKNVTETRTHTVLIGQRLKLIESREMSSCTQARNNVFEGMKSATASQLEISSLDAWKKSLRLRKIISMWTHTNDEIHGKPSWYHWREFRISDKKPPRHWHFILLTKRLFGMRFRYLSFSASLVWTLLVVTYENSRKRITRGMREWTYHLCANFSSSDFRFLSHMCCFQRDSLEFLILTLCCGGGRRNLETKTHAVRLKPFFSLIQAFESSKTSSHWQLANNNLKVIWIYTAKQHAWNIKWKFLFSRGVEEMPGLLFSFSMFMIMNSLLSEMERFQCQKTRIG